MTQLGSGVNGIGHISRRVFLRGGAALALLAAAPAAWARSSVATGRKSLTRSNFTPLLGAQLRITGGGDDVVVVLAEIGNLTPVVRDDDPDRFALLFEAPLGHARTPGIRKLQHKDLGPVSLFVSPVNRGVKAHHYEAVINRSSS